VSNKFVYLVFIIKRYFTTYFTAACFGLFVWSHLRVVN